MEHGDSLSRYNSTNKQTNKQNYTKQSVMPFCKITHSGFAESSAERLQKGMP
jgi:hypothetical protein